MAGRYITAEKHDSTFSTLLKSSKVQQYSAVLFKVLCKIKSMSLFFVLVCVLRVIYVKNIINLLQYSII